jgi:hypothetical protein
MLPRVFRHIITRDISQQIEGFRSSQITTWRPRVGIEWALKLTTIKPRGTLHAATKLEGD